MKPVESNPRQNPESEIRTRDWPLVHWLSAGISIRHHRRSLAAALCLLFVALAHSSFAQGTAFTYQGRLNDGANPANGSYDLRFAIYDSTNNPGILIAGPITNAATAVSNGLFSVSLNFGSGPFAGGQPRWLEVGVRPNGPGAFQTLAPRQQLTPSPYAIHAGSVSPSGISGTYANAVTFNNPGNSFSGNGAGLTDLNASQLTSGTIPDARLGANIARRNTTNTFTGNQAIVSGNLSIGTNVASARLEVAGQVRITGGSPGVGKVLTSDATGLAAWSFQSAARFVTVDAAGTGDYTNINSALAAITPSAANPYVILVRPGTYVETVWLKSHIHLKGAGRDYTFIEGDPVGVTNGLQQVVIGLDRLTNVAISGFTLSAHAGSSPLARLGIYDNASSPVIADNAFINFQGIVSGGSEIVGGIFSSDSSPVIERNTFTNLAFANAGAIQLFRSSGVINGNHFGRSPPVGAFAVFLRLSSGQITGNRFVRWTGIDVDHRNATNALSATIANNHFSGGAEKGIRNQGDTRITGNYIDECSEGIENLRSAIIVGNVFTNCGHPLLEKVSTTAEPTVITGNAFRFSGPFRIEGSPIVSGNSLGSIDLLSGKPVITGNRFQNGINLSPGVEPIVSGNNLPIASPDFSEGVIIGGLGEVELRVEARSNLVINTFNENEGAVDVRGRLNVLSNTVIGGNLEVKGAIDGSFMSLQTGTGQFSNNVAIAGALNVAGPATFATTLSANIFSASGPATFSSLVSAATFLGDGSALTGIHSLDAADGSPSNAVFVNNTGRVGVNLTTPLHHLHVGTTLGTNSLNTSPNVVAVENSLENGRAAFLALAGIGGPDSTNRVEVQVEASESTRRGVVGTTTEHPVHFRVGNSDVMVAATNRFIGINEADPQAQLHVSHNGSGASQLHLEQTANNDFARLRFSSTTKPHWTIAVGGAENVMNFFNPGNGNVLTLTTNGDLFIDGALNPPSDRNVKRDFAQVNPLEVLDKVNALPIRSWAYNNSPDTRHLGPVAQDFHAAFGLGSDDKHIATVDADGVALAAIQGLSQKTEDRSRRAEIKSQKAEARIQKLETENAELKRELAELKQLVGALAGNAKHLKE